VTAPADARAAVQRVVDFYEGLTPAALDTLVQFYTEDARFKDPFNEVQGVPAIRRVFEHMYANLHGPRFVVTQCVVDGHQCFLVWEFRFRFRFQRFDTQTEQVVRGASHLRLAADGRISEHRDYWDAAEELYEKLPLLGALMRWLKRHARR
jgi:ketosteroid isomerase-like protein